MEQNNIERNIKRRKVKKRKLSTFGKRFITGAILTTMLATGAITLSKKEGVSATNNVDLPVIETTEYEDIYEAYNQLAPIINNTTPTIETEETIVIESNNIAPVINGEAYISNDNQTDTYYYRLPEDAVANSTLFVGPKEGRDESSDMQCYYQIRARYGPLIERIASETRWDPRLITALIAQENHNRVDQSRNNTFGATSITSIHDGQTYNYAYFDENGNREQRQITINTDALDLDTSIYMDGYTNADANSIYGAIAIFENYFNEISTFDYLNDAAAFALTLSAYNCGNSQVRGFLNNCNNMQDAFNATFNITNADNHYIANVIDKLPSTTSGSNFYFTTTDGRTITFSIVLDDQVNYIQSIDNNRMANTM